MAGPPSYPDTGAPPGSGQRAGQPRWKTTAIVIIVIALLAAMVILHLTGTLGAGIHG